VSRCSLPDERSAHRAAQTGTVVILRIKQELAAAAAAYAPLRSAQSLTRAALVLLFLRSITMAVALAVLSWSYWYYEESPPPFLAIGSMAVIAAAYSFSYGPLNWLITAELFTVGVRGVQATDPT
jgi:hypothetical protein